MNQTLQFLFSHFDLISSYFDLSNQKIEQWTADDLLAQQDNPLRLKELVLHNISLLPNKSPVTVMYGLDLSSHPLSTDFTYKIWIYGQQKVIYIAAFKNIIHGGFWETHVMKVTYTNQPVLATIISDQEFDNATDECLYDLYREPI